jgi:hypothetical protein
MPGRMEQAQGREQGAREQASLWHRGIRMLTALQWPSWQGQQAAKKVAMLVGMHGSASFCTDKGKKHLAATGSCTATTGCCPRKSCAASTQRGQDRAHLRLVKIHWVAGLQHYCQKRFYKTRQLVTIQPFFAKCTTSGSRIEQDVHKKDKQVHCRARPLQAKEDSKYVHALYTGPCTRCQSM